MYNNFKQTTQTGGRVLSYENHLKLLIDHKTKIFTIKELASQYGLNINTCKHYLYKWVPKENCKYADLNLKHNYFSFIDSSEKAYWLGFLLADGCLQKNGPKISLTLQAKDEQHLDKFFYSTLCTSNKKYYHNNCVQNNVTSYQLYKDLNKAGLYNNKTFTVKFPKINSKYHNHVIRGIFDGDGCISWNKSRNQAQYNIYGTEFVLKEICDCLGENLTIHKDKRSNTFFIARQGINVCKSLYNYLYKDATVWLERKKDKFRELIPDLKDQ